MAAEELLPVLLEPRIPGVGEGREATHVLVEALNHLQKETEAEYEEEKEEDEGMKNGVNQERKETSKERMEWGTEGG